MNKPVGLLLLICCGAMMPLAGCSLVGQNLIANVDDDPNSFQAASVHLKSSFTKLIEPDIDNQKPGKIEAYIELQDQFGDPLKALGRFRFEVFKYQPGTADLLGERFPDGLLDEIDLTLVLKNQKHWDRTLRNYQFSLTLPNIPPSQKKIILQVTFTNQSGKRYEDLLILERQK